MKVNKLALSSNDDNRSTTFNSVKTYVYEASVKIIRNRKGILHKKNIEETKNKLKRYYSKKCRWT